MFGFGDDKKIELLETATNQYPIRMIFLTSASGSVELNLPFLSEFELFFLFEYNDGTPGFQFVTIYKDKGQWTYSDGMKSVFFTDEPSTIVYKVNLYGFDTPEGRVIKKRESFLDKIYINRHFQLKY